jgi:hypothetical protein
MKIKPAAGAIAAGFAIGAIAVLASAHPLNPPGNEKTISIGGPLASPMPGDGAQGHWRGVDCNAWAGPAPIRQLGICEK